MKEYVLIRNLQPEIDFIQVMLCSQKSIEKKSRKGARYCQTSFKDISGDIRAFWMNPTISFAEGSYYEINFKLNIEGSFFISSAKRVEDPIDKTNYIKSIHPAILDANIAEIKEIFNEITFMEFGTFVSDKIADLKLFMLNRETSYKDDTAGSTISKLNKFLRLCQIIGTDKNRESLCYFGVCKLLSTVYSVKYGLSEFSLLPSFILEFQTASRNNEIPSFDGIEELFLKIEALL